MTALIERIGKAYDELPYISAAFAQTAAEHLRTVAHLFGLSAAAPQRARILELGCAAGGNIIPYAVRYPEAVVLGVDLSGVQVGAGQRAIRAMGLRNIHLQQGSIADLDALLGDPSQNPAGTDQFDYIICHGVYSWVPQDIREAILRVSRERLAPDGIAYISYNVYPGWKAKEIVRDAMLLRGGNRPTSAEQLAYARGMINFLHDMAQPGSVLKKIMDENIHLIRHGEAHYLNHEFLELCNSPCYFKDFMAAAKQQGLSYLAESGIATMFASNYDARAAEPLLRECQGSQEVLEQLLDFLTNRTFRQTLLVHAQRAEQIQYGLRHERIAALHIAGHYTAKPDAPGHWRTEQGSSITAGTPVAHQVIETLNAAWPSTVPVRDLIRQASGGSAPENTAGEVLAFVEILIIGDALQCRLEPVSAAHHATAYPQVNASLRQLAQLPGPVPLSLFNAWHQIVRPGAVVEWLLPYVDGKHDLAALTEIVRAGAERGALTFLRGDRALQDPAEIATAAAEHTLGALQWLTDNAMIELPAEGNA
ncbi:methyltransferase regulatory domain-containing protein [Dyella silvatica]|uniref:methyltransferase regulatory domain-containing protein n=1 Tax=Dyella silvatica TaxID=2992128 RepID=UPI00225811D0|nr:methyltransferase regulatory domain-containing protein [Dyella silvatica]